MINRSETWRRLRDFFAGGGVVSPPSSEDLLPPPASHRFTDEELGLHYLLSDIGDKLQRAPTPLPKVTWREIGTAEEKSFLALRDKLISGIPLEMGVDLATGGSETWLMYWDWDEGKIIYRKIDPADMVRRDDGEEGIPNGKH